MSETYFTVGDMQADYPLELLEAREIIDSMDLLGVAKQVRIISAIETGEKISFKFEIAIKKSENMNITSMEGEAIYYIKANKIIAISSISEDTLKFIANYTLSEKGNEYQIQLITAERKIELNVQNESKETSPFKELIILFNMLFNFSQVDNVQCIFGEYKRNYKNFIKDKHIVQFSTITNETIRRLNVKAVHSGGYIYAERYFEEEITEATEGKLAIEMWGYEKLKYLYKIIMVNKQEFEDYLSGGKYPSIEEIIEMDFTKIFSHNIIDKILRNLRIKNIGKANQMQEEEIRGIIERIKIAVSRKNETYRR